MPQDSRGFLAIWAEPPASVIPEYLDWLVNEHLPERVTTPGFLDGRIFRDVDAAGRFFVLYETEAAEVLCSPAYLARGEAPSDWTQRMVRKLNPIVRGAGRIAYADGQGWGGAVAVTRFEGPGGAWVLDPEVRIALERLRGIEGIVSVRVLETDPAITGIRTREKRLRPIEDASFAAALVIESIDIDAAHRAQGFIQDALKREGRSVPTPIFARMRFGLALAQTLPVEPAGQAIGGRKS